jgi:hypothetical protein
MERGIHVLDGVLMEIRRSIGVLALLLASAGGLSAQEYAEPEAPEARLWLDRGDEPLLQRGDRVRIYYRTSASAYTAIFHIDTDGSVQLLHPRAPDDEHFARGGRDYRLLFPQSPYWFVDEYPGKGYFFLLASPEPFDFSDFAYRRYDRGWDLTHVGRAVYEDPYVAIDEYVARLIPDWESVPYALDFISYDVGEPHDYPRFLCYDCHGFQSYASWNPYTYACSSFRVVIWDDPYFYPAYRYRGTRVVFAQPPRGIARFEFKERAAGEAWSPVVRTRQPPLNGSVGYREPAVAAPAMPEFVPPRRRVVPSDALGDDRGSRGSRGSSGALRPPPSTRTAEPRGNASDDDLRNDLRNGVPSTVLPRRGDVEPSTPTRGTPGRATPPSREATPTRPDPTARRVVPFPGRTDERMSVPRSQPRTVPGAVPPTRERPTLQRRPTTASPPSRTGGGSSRVVRPSGGAERPSASRPSTSRPSARPAPARSSRPTVRPPSKAGGGRASPPKRRKPGGGN